MTKARAVWRPLTMALTLAIGFGAVWGILLAWIVSAVAATQLDDYAWEYLVVRQDGTPVVLRQEPTNWNFRQFFDLDRKPVDLPSTEPLLSGGSLQGPESPAERDAPLDWSHRIRFFHDPQRTPIYWYFLHDERPDGSGHFVGYDPVTKSRIGFIGLNGFSEGPIPAEQQFPVRGELMKNHSVYWSQQYHQYPLIRIEQASYSSSQHELPVWVIFVPSGKRLHAVDLRNRTVKTIFESELPIVGVGVEGTDAERQEKTWLYVRTTDHIHVVSSTGEKLRSFATPPEIGARDFQLYELSEGKMLATASGGYDSLEATIKNDIFWLTPEGRVEQSRELTMQSGRRSSPPRVERAGYGLFCPAPLPIAVAAAIIEPVALLSDATLWMDNPPSFSSAVRISFNRWWPTVMVVSILGACLAVWCYHRETKFASSPWQKGLWTAFVFLAGIPGVAGYLLHRRWPVVAKCPACHVPAPQNDDHCAACGTTFPEPARKGIEVFA